MGGKSLRKCEICGIRVVSKTTSDVFLAKFPKERNRCRLWVKATGNEDLAYLPLSKLHENKYICGDHFPDDMFNEKHSRLKKYAIPILNLFQPPLSDDILTNFPLHDSHPEKKGILFNCPASTSKAGVYNDTPQVEEPAHILKKRKIGILFNCPASTSEAGVYNDTPQVEEPAHNLKKRKIDISFDSTPSTSESNTPDDNVEQFEELDSDCRPHSIKKEKIDITIDCPGSNSKASILHENKPRINGQAHANKNPDAAVHGYKKFKMTPRKKMIKKLQCIQKLLKTLSDSSFDLENAESDFFKGILKEAAKMQTRKPRGKRWNMKTKISCMQIFKRSPRTYRHSQHNIPMPSIRTVQRLLKCLPTDLGINAASLKQKHIKALSMLPENKLCVLIFDETFLKKKLCKLWNKRGSR